MCYMVPICYFLADLKVFSYIWCLIILICVEFKFIPHARIELNTSMHKPVVVFCTVGNNASQRAFFGGCRRLDRPS